MISVPEADAFARRVHGRDRTKAGIPLTEHVRRVAGRVKFDPDPYAVGTERDRDQRPGRAANEPVADASGSPMLVELRPILGFELSTLNGLGADEPDDHHREGGNDGEDNEHEQTRSHGHRSAFPPLMNGGWRQGDARRNARRPRRNRLATHSAELRDQTAGRTSTALTSRAPVRGPRPDRGRERARSTPGHRGPEPRSAR